MDILRRYDRGESTAAICNALNLSESTLRTIRKDREKIMAAVKQVQVAVSQRCRQASLTSWSGWRKCWYHGWIIGSVRALT